MHISKRLGLVLVITVLLSLVIPFAGLTTQVEAAVTRTGGESSWDFTWNGVHYTGGFVYTLSEQHTEGKLTRYKYHVIYEETGVRVSDGTSVFHSKWANSVQVKYDRVTGEVKISQSNSSGTYTGYGMEKYSYRTVVTWTNGELRSLVLHY